MGDKIIKSVRANAEVFERLSAISKGTGMDQGATLEALINAYDVQQAREQVPERAADIEDFDCHIQGIQAAFLRSLELASSAEMRARADFKALLDARDRTIATLQQQVDDAQTALRKAQDAAIAYQNQVVELSDKLAELDKRDRLASLLEQMQARLDQDTTAPTGTSTRRKRKDKDDVIS